MNKKDKINVVDGNLVLEFHKILSNDILRILKYFPTEFSSDGHMIPEKDLFLLPVATIPKTRSKKAHKRVKYKDYLEKQIKSAKKELERYKNRETLVYIIAYLTKKNYEEKDVDNLAKPVIDVLKLYIGDDSKIQNLIVEKKLVPEHPIMEPEWREEFLMVITTPKYGEYLLKGK